MEVRNGYKQTDIGVIPQDWEIATLRDLVHPERKITYGIVVPGPVVQNGIPMIRAQDYSNGWVDLEKLYRVSPEIDKSYKRSKVITGDILFTIVGSVGNLAKVPSMFNGSNITQQTARLSFNVKIASADYYLNILQSEIGKREITNYTKSGVQPSLNLSDVEKFLLPYPPLAEQKAIAEALSNADAFIEAVEQLLTKKRQVKQGAMSELLTGKRRLSGFTGEWEEIRLGDLLDFERPDKYIVKNTDYFETGDIPVLTANKSFVLGYTDEEFGIYNNFPVIIFDDFTTDKKFVDFPFKVKSSAIKILKPKNNKVNLRFIYGKMQLIYFPISDHKRYYISEYQHIKIPMPDEKEQTAIAEILSDMDAEITALEGKLVKARQVKAGMMSELLTGKIRLV